MLPAPVSSEIATVSGGARPSIGSIIRLPMP